MMTMTSDKRREVAANLRRIDDVAQALIEERMNRLGNDPLAELVVISLGLCVALDGAGVHPEAVGDFWGLLADLIDPTCNDEADVNPVDGFTCSACGWSGRIEEDDTDLDTYQEPMFDDFAEFSPHYCPNCRARVVGE